MVQYELVKLIMTQNTNKEVTIVGGKLLIDRYENKTKIKISMFRGFLKLKMRS